MSNDAMFTWKTVEGQGLLTIFIVRPVEKQGNAGFVFSVRTVEGQGHE